MGTCNGGNFMNDTYDSYSEYMFHKNESKLIYLIRSKYLKLLGEFIENMYPGLKFDIYIKHRNPKQQKIDWYGHTYMELKIFDVFRQPMYDPRNFEPSYRTPHCNEYLSNYGFYSDIESFIPEINKYLLISYVSTLGPHDSYIMESNNIPDFECWTEYWKKTHIPTSINRAFF